MKKKSIIIIDDELLIRDLLYDFFSDRDWLVAVTETGDKCLELLRSRSFDIALIDIKLAEDDGLSLVRRLKSQNPTLPVVVMTGFPSVETAVEALRLKVDDYFIKPFNINKLYKRIDTLAEDREPRSEPVKAEDFQL